MFGINRGMFKTNKLWEKALISAMIKWATRIFVNLAPRYPWQPALDVNSIGNDEPSFGYEGAPDGAGTLWEIWEITRQGKIGITTFEVWYPGMP